jgi:hypothetical protein
MSDIALGRDGDASSDSTVPDSDNVISQSPEIVAP